MKTRYWILTSVLLHATFAVSFYWARSNGPLLNDEVIDLTVIPFQIGSAPNPPSAKNALPVTKFVSSKGAGTQNPSEPPVSSAAENANPTVTEPAAGSHAASEGPVAWGEVTTLPKIVKEVKAPYPAEAKSARIEGPVILDVLISKEGQVNEVYLVQGPGHGLNESAIDALKQFQFSPAFKGPKKVAVKIRYTYRFKLGVN